VSLLAPFLLPFVSHRNLKFETFGDQEAMWIGGLGYKKGVRIEIIGKHRLTSKLFDCLFAFFADQIRDFLGDFVMNFYTLQIS
jgi:hypothetical protein